LTQFLREFAAFLKAEGIQDRSFFHVSDEPEGEDAFQQYRSARLLLRELAPWIKVTDGVTTGWGVQDHVVAYGIQNR